MGPEEQATPGTEPTSAGHRRGGRARGRGRRGGRGRGRGRRPPVSPQSASASKEQPEGSEGAVDSMEEAASALHEGPPAYAEESVSAEPHPATSIEGQPESEPEPQSYQPPAHPGSQTAIAQTIEQVNDILRELRQALEEMEEVLETLELAERQKNADEREIDSLRRALGNLRRPRGAS